MKALEPYVQEGHQGRTGRSTSPATAGARYFLKNVSTENLIKMKGSQAVFSGAALPQGADRDEQRQTALADLAKLDSKTRTGRAARRHRRATISKARQEESVTFDLVRLLTEPRPRNWARCVAELEKLAVTANSR